MSEPTTAEIVQELRELHKSLKTDLYSSPASQLAGVAADRLEATESTIKVISELPDKWQKSPTDYVYEIAFKEGMQHCADELQALIKKEQP